MPNLNEFFDKKEANKIDTTFEKIGGVRSCMKCEIDVVGGLWDSDNRVMYWTCSSGHENKLEVS